MGLRGSSMYKKLLVADDGSEPGTAALNEAIKLAKADGGELHLVFVIYHPKTFGHPIINLAAVEEALEAEGRGVLERAAAQAQAAGVTASTAMVEARREPIASTLLAEAARWNADLIVMGHAWAPRLRPRGARQRRRNSVARDHAAGVDDSRARLTSGS